MAVSLLIVLAVALFFLIVVGGIGLLVLIKLGVIASYAVKDEPEDRGTYGLDQSRPADNE